MRWLLSRLPGALFGPIGLADAAGRQRTPTGELLQLPDESLVARARRGGASGRAAFDALVRRHEHWLVRMLTLMVGQAEAADVAQEAFVRAYLAIGRYEGNTGFRAWIRVIASRQAFNRRRAAQTRRRKTGEMQRLAEPVRAPQAGVAERIGAREVVQTILPTLSYPYREILVLRYVEELALSDIAAILDIGSSAAKMRLTRAREAFVAQHEQLMEGGSAFADGP